MAEVGLDKLDGDGTRRSSDTSQISIHTANSVDSTSPLMATSEKDPTFEEDSATVTVTAKANGEHERLSLTKRKHLSTTDYSSMSHRTSRANTIDPRIPITDAGFGIEFAKLSPKFQEFLRRKFIYDPTNENEGANRSWYHELVFVPDNPHHRTVFQILKARTSVLVVLLVVQSVSAIILRHYDAVLDEYTAVAIYLPLIIGTAGNTGNQVAVDIIRCFGSGEDYLRMQWWDDDPRPYHIRGFHTIASLGWQELKLGTCNSIILFIVAWVRIYLFDGFLIASSIGVSLLAIVFVSSWVGFALPLIFKWAGFDPHTAAPASQVSLDIIGVSILGAITTAWLLHL